VGAKHAQNENFSRGKTWGLARLLIPFMAPGAGQLSSDPSLRGVSLHSGLLPGVTTNGSFTAPSGCEFLQFL